MLQLIFYLIISPIIFGIFERVVVRKKREISILSVIEGISYGFFMEYFLFTLINHPIMWLDGYFHVTVLIMRVVCVLLTLFVILITTYKYKKGECIIKYIKFNQINRNVLLMMSVGLLLIVMQTIRIAMFQTTDYNDNKTYIAYANDLNQTDMYNHLVTDTGEVLNNRYDLTSKYTLSSWYSFEAFLARSSGFHVSTVVNRVLPLVLVPIMYIVFGLWAKCLLIDRKKQVMFMLFLIILNELLSREFNIIFLIWPTYGKCVLALIILPLIVYELLFQNAERIGMIFCLSTVGCAASNMGYAIIPITLAGVGLIDFIKYKSLKNIWKYIVVFIPVLIFVVQYFIW